MWGVFHCGFIQALWATLAHPVSGDEGDPFGRWHQPKLAVKGNPKMSNKMSDNALMFSLRHCFAKSHTLQMNTWQSLSSSSVHIFSHLGGRQNVDGWYLMDMTFWFCIFVLQPDSLKSDRSPLVCTCLHWRPCGGINLRAHKWPCYTARAYTSPHVTCLNAQEKRCRWRDACCVCDVRFSWLRIIMQQLPWRYLEPFVGLLIIGNGVMRLSCFFYVSKC